MAKDILGGSNALSESSGLEEGKTCNGGSGRWMRAPGRLERGSWSRMELAAGGREKGRRGQTGPDCCGGGGVRERQRLVHQTRSPSQQAGPLLFNHTHDAMELIDVAVPLRRNTAKTPAGKINKCEAMAELPKGVWDPRKRQRRPASRGLAGAITAVSASLPRGKEPVLPCPPPGSCDLPSDPCFISRRQLVHRYFLSCNSEEFIVDKSLFYEILIGFFFGPHDEDIDAHYAFHLYLHIYQLHCCQMGPHHCSGPWATGESDKDQSGQLSTLSSLCSRLSDWGGILFQEEQPGGDSASLRLDP